MLQKLTFMALGTTFFFSFEADATRAKGWKPMPEVHQGTIHRLHQARKDTKVELRSAGKIPPKAVKATAPDVFDLSAACIVFDQGPLGSCVINAFAGAVQGLVTLDKFKKAGGTIASLQTKAKAKTAIEAPSPRAKTVLPTPSPQPAHVAVKTAPGKAHPEKPHAAPSPKPKPKPKPSPVVAKPAPTPVVTHTVQASTPNISTIKASSPIFSRLFGYREVLGMQGEIDDTGTDAGTAFLSYNRGWAYEKTYPYNVTKYTDTPSMQAYTEAALNASKIRVSVALVPVDSSAISKIESLVASGKFVLLAMNLYDSFESDTVARTGLVPLPKKREALLGGHEMKIVGYDRTKRRMLVSNSWGKTWGLNGFCWIPYEMITNPKHTIELMQIKLASDI